MYVDLDVIGQSGTQKNQSMYPCNMALGVCTNLALIFFLGCFHPRDTGLDIDFCYTDLVH